MAYRLESLVNVDMVADFDARGRVIPLGDSTLLSIII